LRTRGFKIDPNKLRAMAPFVVEADATRASRLVDQLLKDPLNKSLIERDPKKFLSGQILFKSQADQTPRQYPITQLMALGGRQVLTDEQGAPIIADAEDGKIGTTFQEVLGAGLDAFAAQYNRKPTPQERQRIIAKAIETTRERPETGPSATQQQRQARQVLKATILRGEPTRPIAGQLRAAGLEPEVEIADLRRELIAVGRTLSADADYRSPDDLFEAGRKAVGGTTPSPPADPGALDRLREVLPGPVGSRQAPIKQRFRYTPQGLVPVEP
jgi:hypothetical protein